jgi:hypothetical protein
VIEVHGVDPVVAQTRWIICILLVDGGKPFSDWIKALQTRGMGADLRRSLTVLLDLDIHLGSALLVALVHGEVRKQASSHHWRLSIN